MEESSTIFYILYGLKKATKENSFVQKDEIGMYGTKTEIKHVINKLGTAYDEYYIVEDYTID